MLVYLLKRAEIIVAKGEIAHHEQFLPLARCFQNCVQISLQAESRKCLVGNSSLLEALGDGITTDPLKSR